MVAPIHTQPPPLLTLEERLDLEELVLPHLSSADVERMWLRLNLPIGELPRENLGLQWEHLLTRCLQSGQLSLLARLLVRQVPSLQHEPLIQKLRS